MMENDPAYIELVKKSHILQKYHRSNPKADIPQIPKKQKIYHSVISSGVLSTIIHLVAFPLDTIKVRKISKNKVIDVAKFNTNKVVDKSYLSIMIGNLTFLTVGQEGFLLGVTAESILKTFIDMSKVSSQMANQKLDMEIVKKSFGYTLGFSFLRDLTSRGAFIYLTNKLIEYNKAWVMRNERNKYNIFFAAGILSTIISHPFDVIFTKLASQRTLKYKGLSTPLIIFKEQGWRKYVSGLEFRLFYNLIGIVIMSNFYENLLGLLIEAY